MKKHLIAFLLILSFLIPLGAEEASFYSGKIYLYGESHGNEKIQEKELQLWGGYYEEGMRHLFVELPYYTAQFLNLWMKADDDVILDELFEDSKGTAGNTESSIRFFKTIKKDFPETVFHGTDVGHQFRTTGKRYLEYLASHNLKDSSDYERTEKAIEQGKLYYTTPKDHLYREKTMAQNFMATLNFVDTLESVENKDIMGIYGSAHTGLDQLNFTNEIPSMANMLNSFLKGRIFSLNLTAYAKNMDPLEEGKITLDGREYRTLYFGKQDLKGFKDFECREFWRIEAAYDHFKSKRKTGDVLPYRNFPMTVEVGQMIKVVYTKLDGTVIPLYYLADGSEWKGKTVTVNIEMGS